MKPKGWRRDKQVQPAEITRAAMVKLASQHITAKIMNTLSLMIPQEKWRTQIGACQVVLELADKNPDQVENRLP